MSRLFPRIPSNSKFKSSLCGVGGHRPSYYKCKNKFPHSPPPPRIFLLLNYGTIYIWPLIFLKSQPPPSPQDLLGLDTDYTRRKKGVYLFPPRIQWSVGADWRSQQTKSQINYLELTFYGPWVIPCQESTHTSKYRYSLFSPYRENWVTASGGVNSLSF